MRFIGTHEHTLDTKGRLTLPSRFRPSLGENCVIGRSQYDDKCLAIWRNEDFEAFSTDLLAHDLHDASVRKGLRIWASEAFIADIDGNGRLAIPQRLRAYADLNREVLVIGALETIEIWAPEAWAAYRGSDDA